MIHEYNTPVNNQFNADSDIAQGDTVTPNFLSKFLNEDKSMAEAMSGGNPDYSNQPDFPPSTITMRLHR